MSDDMEIVKEALEKSFGKYYECHENPLMVNYGTLLKILPDAVNREIVKVIDEIGIEIDADYSELFQKFRKKYSPRSRYCEGMQKAINKKRVEIKNGYYFIYGVEKDGIGVRIDECYWCSDGKNCIEKS